jgi:hypothetical protein
MTEQSRNMLPEQYVKYKIKTTLLDSFTQFKPSVASCINVRFSSQSKQEMSEYSWNNAQWKIK